MASTYFLSFIFFAENKDFSISTMVRPQSLKEVLVVLKEKRAKQGSGPNSPKFDWERMEKLLKVNLPDHRVTLQILTKIEEVFKAVVENKDTLRQDMTVHNTKFSEILNMLNLWL